MLFDKHLFIYLCRWRGGLDMLLAITRHASGICFSICLRGPKQLIKMQNVVQKPSYDHWKLERGTSSLDRYWYQIVYCILIAVSRSSLACRERIDRSKGSFQETPGIQPSLSRNISHERLINNVSLVIIDMMLTKHENERRCHTLEEVSAPWQAHVRFKLPLSRAPAARTLA